MDLLCCLLVSGPEKVLMHSNSFREGQEDISEIRRLAEQVKEDYLRRCHSESVQPLADRVQHPRPRENPAPRVRPPGPSSNDEFSLKDKLKIFDHLTPMVEYTPTDKQLPGVRRFPPTVRAELQAKLKKGTLLSFLEAHPKLFRVTYTGEKSAKGKPQFTVAVLYGYFRLLYDLYGDFRLLQAAVAAEAESRVSAGGGNCQQSQQAADQWSDWRDTGWNGWQDRRGWQDYSWGSGWEI